MIIFYLCSTFHNKIHKVFHQNNFRHKTKMNQEKIKAQIIYANIHLDLKKKYKLNATQMSV